MFITKIFIFKRTAMLQRIIFLLILLYFLITFSIFLDKLGLDEDEADYGLKALNFLSSMQLCTLRNMHFPIMLGYYTGTTIIYLLVPFFLIFDHTVFALRISQIIYPLGIFICIYYVFSRWFNKRIGLITILLLGINSTFIRATRIGIVREEISQIFLVWLGIALLQLYLDNKGRLYLYLSSFIFGIALYTKIMFLGYFLGVIIAFLILWKRSRKFFIIKIFKKRYDITIFTFMFMLGSAPLLVYNILNKGETIKLLWHSLWNTTSFGWNNLDFLHNLKLRTHDFYSLLSSQIISDSIHAPRNNVNPLFFYLSLLGILFYLFFIKKEIFSKNKIFFLILTYLTLFVLTCFIPEGYEPGHIIIVIPIVEIISALFIGALPPFLKNKIVSYSLILLFFIPNSYIEFNIIKSYLNDIKSGKSSFEYSALVYDLAYYLQRNDIKSAYSLTRIINFNVDFITDRKVLVDCIYCGIFHTKETTVDLTYKYKLKKLDKFYLVVQKGDRISEQLFKHLSEFIYADNKNITLLKNFINIKRDTCLELYKIE